MKFVSATLEFKLGPDERLKPLVKRGYSNPTPEDPYARRELTDYGGAEICVERTDEDPYGPMSSVTVTPGETTTSSVTALLCVAMHDLCEAGLIDPKEA